MKRWMLAIAAVATSVAAWAQGEPGRAALEAALKDAQSVQTLGPAEIGLRDQASLKLSTGQVYFPAPQANRVMEAMGNHTDATFVGLILPTTPANWMVAVRYEPSGYIRDDDAKDWKADELLASIREGTQAANEARRKQGFPEIEVLGWAEAPAYDAAAHRLVWAMKARDKNPQPGDAPGVNYNTYALGREGYFSLNLVTDLNTLETDKPVARDLLANLEFNAGKRYGDFVASTDRVAEYGLAALVAGVAAKKLGFFALIAAFVVKFFKVIALAVVGAFAGFARFWKGTPGA